MLVDKVPPEDVDAARGRGKEGELRRLNSDGALACVDTETHVF